MNKIDKFLLDEMRKATGAVLAIGLNNKMILDTIDKNDNINYCELLNTTFTSKETKKRGRTKKVTVKEFKKKYKKKKINYMICDYNLIRNHLKHFVKNSVYINKNYLYIYGNKNELDIQLVKSRYSRYNTKINFIENDKEILLIIDNSKSKNKIIKDLFYLVYDNLYNALELFSNFLVN